MKLTTMNLWLKVLGFLVFDLIALGGVVRALNAGLACPDWPLCFGQVLPEWQLQVYLEVIHRFFAGAIGLVLVGLSVFVFRSQKVPGRVKGQMAVALAVLMVQVIFGGLTVLKLLHFGTVTTHLVLALILFSLILWMHYELSEKNRDQEIEKGFVKLPALALGAVAGVFFLIAAQIFLGGLVSSNYAGLVCPDFPLCNGQWAPTFSGLIGIQVLHRFGAYAAALGVLGQGFYFWMAGRRQQKWCSAYMKKISLTMSGVILIQILVGILNVLLQIPPVITVVHLALAATLLALQLRLAFLVTLRMRSELVASPVQTVQSFS